MNSATFLYILTVHIKNCMHITVKTCETRSLTYKNLLHKCEHKALRLMKKLCFRRVHSCPPTQLCYLFNPLWACFSSESKSRSSNLLLAGAGAASLFASEEERDIKGSLLLSSPNIDILWMETSIDLPFLFCRYSGNSFKICATFGWKLG